MRGFAYDVVNAVLAAGADDVRDAIARAEALTAVRGSDDFAAISAAFKRIKNILRQAEEKGLRSARRSGVKLAPEAQQLADAAAALAPRSGSAARAARYGEALALIATLRPPWTPSLTRSWCSIPTRNPRCEPGPYRRSLRNFSGIADFSEMYRRSTYSQRISKAAINTLRSLHDVSAASRSKWAGFLFPVRQPAIAYVHATEARRRGTV